MAGACRGDSLSRVGSCCSDPFSMLSARRIRTEYAVWVHQHLPSALSSVHPAGPVCVCVCAGWLVAGSIFVYWTTFCQLLIAHQLAPTVQQRRFCRLRLQGASCKEREDKKRVRKVQKVGPRWLVGARSPDW